MIRHIVLIKTQNLEELDKALELVRSLIGKVEGLKSIEIAKDFSGRSKGFDHLFVMNFIGESYLKNWSQHPEHMPIRAILKSIAEMIVFDYRV